MGGQTDLTAAFEANRPRLKAVALRMLGAPSEAEDAVQEAWLRLSRADAASLHNLSGWLTTVVAHICLDMLRARAARREAPLGPSEEQQADAAPSAESEAVLADGVGLALFVVLNKLAPAERVAFVLHDMFDLSFDEIAPIVRRSVPAARQLASRARRRVRGAPDAASADRARQRDIVVAFLTASRTGDMTALLAVLDPDIVLQADDAAIAAARASPEGLTLAPQIDSAPAVAEIFKGRAKNAKLAWIDGDAGFVFAPGGVPRVVVCVGIDDGRITNLNFIANPDDLADCALELLEP